VTSQAAPLVDFAPFLKDATGILIAVSGGPDSMALMHMLRAWPEHPPLTVATVHHGLRAEASAEAAFVAGEAAGLGLTHSTLDWTGEKPATGIQEAARNARYALLVNEAKRLGFSHVVTAHHADDQAETVLMRLVAGSGIGGLGGMRQQVQRDGIIHLRPLLDISKSALVAYCQVNAVPFVSDPSNMNPRFGRARMRGLMASLAAEGLTAERLTTIASRARQTEDALNTVAETVLGRADCHRTDCVVQVNWRVVSPEPQAVRIRALAKLLLLSRGDADGIKLAGLERLSAEIDDAVQLGGRLRRSIADRLVTLSTKGQLSITAAPARRGAGQA
jgi:tRNA(Ile)-lysidine synthase